MTNGWWIIPATLIGAVFWALAATMAAAQQKCDTREAITTELTHTLGQLPQVMGLGDNGQIYEWWSGQDGSWIATAQIPGGNVCILQRGESFVRLDPKFGEPA